MIDKIKKALECAKTVTGTVKPEEKNGDYLLTKAYEFLGKDASDKDVLNGIQNKLSLLNKIDTLRFKNDSKNAESKAKKETMIILLKLKGVAEKMFAIILLYPCVLGTITVITGFELTFICLIKTALKMAIIALIWQLQWKIIIKKGKK